MVTRNTPVGRPPPASVATASPFRPAATRYRTRCVPGWTAVTVHRKIALWPGASLPRAQVLEYAVWPPAPPPPAARQLAGQTCAPGPRSTTHTGRDELASTGWLGPE